MKKSLSLALTATLLLALFACGKAPAPIPNPPLILGEKYLSDLDYEQALLQFDQAIEIEPKNPRGYLGKADALLHLERQADAVMALGVGAKATGGETSATLKSAQAEVELSPVDGYVGLSSAYEKLGWREIALALLSRVCGELPEERELREALERMLGAIKNAGWQNDEPTEAIPENIFTRKDVEALGMFRDNFLDVYAAAAKCGISRSEVDAAKPALVSGFADDGSCNYSFGSTEEGNYLHLFEHPYGGSISFYYNVSGLTLPGGVKIGMTLDEALDCFYCPATARAEVKQAMTIKLPLQLENPDDYATYFVDIYNYSSDDFIGSASLYPGASSNSNGETWIPHYSLFYSEHFEGVQYYYEVIFDPSNNLVNEVTIRTDNRN